MQNPTKNNMFFHFLKGIGCLLVIFGHFTMPGVPGQIMMNATEFTVLVFYMISGYYSYEVPVEELKKRMIKMIQIFISSLVCFFVCAVFQRTLNGTLPQFFKDQFSFNALIKFVVFCTVDYAIPLWYLIGLIETYALWILIVKFNLQKKSYILIPILELCYFTLFIYCDTNGLEWHYKMNFLSCSFVNFLIGIYVRDYQEEFEKIDDKLLIAVAVIGYIVALIPRLFEVKIRFSSIGVFFYSVPIFILAVKHPNWCFSKPICEIGKKYSLDIYIFHLLIGYALTLVCGFFMDVDSTLFLTLRPFVTALLAVIWAMIFYRIKKVLYPPKYIIKN